MLVKHYFIKFNLSAVRLKFPTLHISKRHQTQKLFNLVGEYLLQHISLCRQNNFLIDLLFLFQVYQQTTLNNMYGNCEVPKLIKTLISFLLEEVLIIKRKYLFHFAVILIFRIYVQQLLYLYVKEAVDLDLVKFL